MTHSPQKKKLDELLSGAVDLQAQPDFAEWRRSIPRPIEALKSLPTIITRRRYAMIRIVRYSTSAAAAILLLAVGGVVDAFSATAYRRLGQR